MKMFDISGRKAILTGGTKGLGLAMAEVLLEAGCEVVIIGSSEQVLTVSNKFKEKGFKCHGIRGELGTSLESNEQIFYEAFELLGEHLDIMVNNAAIQIRYLADEFPLDVMRKIFDVNLVTTFQYTQLATKVMLPNGKGKVINIASLASFFGSVTSSAYSATKGGIVQLTKSFCNDCAGRGINYNAIAPGFMLTAMLDGIMKDPVRSKATLARIPQGRFGVPEDLKGTLIYLASNASDYVNGETIVVDGGYLNRS